MIGFVILNYNTWEMTTKCVESIFDTCQIPHTIYIVDNGSTNDSYQQLANLYGSDERVRVIAAENLGYAIGNNTGMRAAMKDGYEILTVVNNDVIFLENSIQEMYDYLMEHPDVAVACPYILSPEGELQNLPSLKPVTVSDYFLYNTKLNKLVSKEKYQHYHEDYYLAEKDIHEDPIQVYKFSGCCFTARSRSLDQIGLFDEHTFLYYEEDILSQKMHKAGLTAFFLPQAKIVHHHGLTTGKDNLFVDTEMLKSEIYFLSKVYELGKPKLLAIYADRALTPLMKKMKKTYPLSFQDYRKFLKATWAHFKKYS